MKKYQLASFEVDYFNRLIASTGLHQDGTPIGLHPLLQTLDIDFRFSTLTPNVNGLAVVPGNGRRSIRVRRDLSSPWRRFVLGHEIGHILQHLRGKALFTVARDTANLLNESLEPTALLNVNFYDPIEAEAHAISAFLYVPIEILRQQLYTGVSFEDIAEQLDLPVPAVRLRYEIALATGEFL